MKILKTILTTFFLIGLFFVVFQTLKYFKIKGQNNRLGGVQYLNITGHVSSTGTPPTLVAGGTDYVATSIQAGSNDFAGSFTGVVPTAGAGQLTLNFVSAYNFAPKCLASIVSAQPTTTFYVTASVSSFSLNFIAGNVSGTKQFNYICIQ